MLIHSFFFFFGQIRYPYQLFFKASPALSQGQHGKVIISINCGNFGFPGSSKDLHIMKSQNYTSKD